MANVLPKEKQVQIISALCEGSGIRQIERMTGVHRDTIMRLGVKVGNGCAVVMDAKMQELSCQYLQFDEIWGFIGKKERHTRFNDDPQFGDVWTFCAIDSDTNSRLPDEPDAGLRLVIRQSVKEKFQGKTIWEGIVEIFELHGHPKATHAYAWAHETDDPKKPRRHVTVLKIPPVVSPETAVRAAIVQEFRNLGTTAEEA